MDVASKIKLMKEKSQQLDQEFNETNARIKELTGLVDSNKAKADKLEEAKKREADLLASL
jgi:hypothetical protein